MATERIDIVIASDGSRTVKRDLDELGASAEKAAGQTDVLKAEIDRLTKQNGGLSKELQDVKAGLAGASADAQKHAGAIATLEQQYSDVGEFLQGVIDGLQSEAAEHRTTGAAQEKSRGSMFAWKQEAGRSREAAMFLTGTLQSLAPATGLVGTGLRSMATVALASAGPMVALVAAMEAIRFGATWVADVIEKQSRSQQEAAKQAREHAEALRQLTRASDDFIESLTGGIDPGAKAMRDALREVEPETKRMRDEIDRLADSWSVWGSSLEETQAKVKRLWADIADLETKAREEGARRAAAAEAAAANQAYSKQIEERTKTGQQAEALEERFAADRVRIWGEANRQIAQLQQQGPVSAETQRMISAIRSNATEQATRADESAALRHSAFMRQQALVGASEERRIAAETAGVKEQLETQLAQARRAHDDEAVKRLDAEISVVQRAGRIKLEILRAETLAAGALAEAQRNQENTEIEMQAALARADRWEVASNIGGTMTVEGARRRMALKQELDAEAQLLEDAKREHPELAGEIEWAKTALVRRGVQERERLRLQEQADLRRQPQDDRQLRIEAGEGSFADGFLQQLDFLEKNLADFTAEGGARFAEFTDGMIDGFAEATARGIAFGDNVGDSLLNMARNALATVNAELMKILMKLAITQIGGLFGGGGGGGISQVPTGGGYGASGMSLGVPQLSLSGARASGGPVEAMHAYLVGEQGREAFVPSTAGTILPNSALAPNLKVTLVNQTTREVVAEPEYVSANEVRMMIRELAPREVARDMRNPNGRTSKAVVSNHQTARRR